MPIPQLGLHSYDRVTLYAVDDDDQYLQVFRVAAAQFSNLNVRTFNQAKPLLDLVGGEPATPFALFFLDIRLGPVRGFEICRRIRDKSSFALAPVIIMSSSMLQDDIDEAERSGANSYFHKPPGAKDRSDAIRRQLSYWLEDAKLPVMRVPSSTPATKPKGSGAKKRETRERGRPLYYLDKLRQEVLVGLLKDVNELCGEQLPPIAADKLSGALVSFEEIFTFREQEFGVELLSVVTSFVSELRQWLKLGEDQKLDQTRRREKQILHWSKARGLRETLGKALFSLRLKDASQDKLLRVDSWIWTAFSDLGDSPSFPHLYLSLKRFQAKAF